MLAANTVLSLGIVAAIMLIPAARGDVEAEYMKSSVLSTFGAVRAFPVYSNAVTMDSHRVCGL